MSAAETALPLHLEGLSLSARDGRPLLQIDKLSVAPGTRLGVQGASGAGKSTFLAVLAGLIAPDRGQVRWGGTDLAALPDHARAAFRAAHLGMIFQDFLLFDELDGLGNASLAAAFAPAPRRVAIRSAAAGWMERLGLAASAKGRSVASFSGGERQRVAVARALAGDPRVLLADEPTAALDRGAADRLAGDLIAQTGAGRGLVVVSHDPGLIARMDRVLTLADGRIVADSHG